MHLDGKTPARYTLSDACPAGDSLIFFSASAVAVIGFHAISSARLRDFFRYCDCPCAAAGGHGGGPVVHSLRGIDPPPAALVARNHGRRDGFGHRRDVDGQAASRRDGAALGVDGVCPGGDGDPGSVPCGLAARRQFCLAAFDCHLSRRPVVSGRLGPAVFFACVGAVGCPSWRSWRRSSWVLCPAPGLRSCRP